LAQNGNAEVRGAKPASDRAIQNPKGPERKYEGPAEPRVHSRDRVANVDEQLRYEAGHKISVDDVEACGVEQCSQLVVRVPRANVTAVLDIVHSLADIWSVFRKRGRE
jgi:hypothetical protein